MTKANTKTTATADASAEERIVSLRAAAETAAAKLVDLTARYDRLVQATSAADFEALQHGYGELANEINASRCAQLRIQLDLYNAQADLADGKRNSPELSAELASASDDVLKAQARLSGLQNEYQWFEEAAQDARQRAKETRRELARLLHR
ncbi:MAG: hypothetical protein ACR2PL_22205 [Dehalococcoidia bacterium]